MESLAVYFGVGIFIVMSLAILYVLRNPPKSREYKLADHVYERRQADWDIETPINKKGWSRIYKPTDDKTRLADNYAEYQAIEKGFTL